MVDKEVTNEETMNATQTVRNAIKTAPEVLRSKLISDVRRIARLPEDQFITALRELWASQEIALNPVHSRMVCGLTAEQCDGYRCGSQKFVFVTFR